MGPRGWLASTALFLGWMILSSSLEAQQVRGGHPGSGVLEARIWMDRGETPVVQRGERVRLYYHTNRSAYVSVFHLDTDGTVRLVHPSSPRQDHHVRGGRDYRLLFPQTPYWHVDDFPGTGFFFIVASPHPFDFSALRYAHGSRSWNLGAVGSRVYSDPYVAMDDYVSHLVPGWRGGGYALDFVSYHVGRTHSYPRFLCYDCHTFRPYRSWNPYRVHCRSFRVVIFTDPYYYPAYRYRGTRVVYPRPLRPRQPRFSFKERAEGEPATPRVVSRAPEELTGGEPDVRRAVARRPAELGGGPGAEGSGPDSGSRSVTPRGYGPASEAASPPPGTGERTAIPRDAASEGDGTDRDRLAPSPARLHRTDEGVSGPPGRDAGGERTVVPLVPREDSPEPSRTRPILERRPSEGDQREGSSSIGERPRGGGAAAGAAEPRDPGERRSFAEPRDDRRRRGAAPRDPARREVERRPVRTRPSEILSPRRGERSGTVDGRVRIRPAPAPADRTRTRASGGERRSGPEVRALPRTPRRGNPSVRVPSGGGDPGSAVRQRPSGTRGSVSGTRGRGAPSVQPTDPSPALAPALQRARVRPRPPGGEGG